jgi:hypothetical protein
MRRAGRVSLVSILALVAIAMVAVVLLFSKQSLSNVGGQFMDALARGDVNKLAELSSLPKDSPDEVKQKWEFATQVAGKDYSFKWTITSESQASEDSGTVRLQVERNFGSGSSYGENFELPMVKVNGQWKVDVAGISREMYPGLPKA